MIPLDDGISIYKKGLISELRKNYIFPDINYFVKMSVSLLARALPNFCGRTSSNTSVNIKISHVVLMHYD